jgi:hypothetical protein
MLRRTRSRTTKINYRTKFWLKILRGRDHCREGEVERGTLKRILEQQRIRMRIAFNLI